MIALMKLSLSIFKVVSFKVNSLGLAGASQLINTTSKTYIFSFPFFFFLLLTRTLLTYTPALLP
jgi:hypothetical protein